MLRSCDSRSHLTHLNKIFTRNRNDMHVCFIKYQTLSPFKVKAIQFMKKSSALKHWIPYLQSCKVLKLDPLFEIRCSFDGRMHWVHVYIEVKIVSRLCVLRLDNACLGGEWNLISERARATNSLKFRRYKSLIVYFLNLDLYSPQSLGIWNILKADLIWYRLISSSSWC